ncbi:MAG: acyl-CoA dehydratase activase [Clostridia bacterium]|nr:acyl-CoA dehydratase activase [Clostridia bacterium]
MYVAGMDIGSIFSKAIILKDGQVVASLIKRTGGEIKAISHRLMEEALAPQGLQIDDLKSVVATGYGRISVPFADKQVTEISCFGRGVANSFPEVRTVIDIGGQDSKGIKIDERGKVQDFVMNDKCAAGTGRFLEVMANALEVSLEDMGPLALQSGSPEEIGITCTVFAESQVISLVGEGRRKVDIVAGIHQAIAERIHGMLRMLRIEERIAITGGGAKNIGLVKELEKRLGTELIVPEEPQLIGAHGAALLALEMALGRKGS